MTQRFKTVGLGPYRKHCLNFKTVDNCTISLNKKNEPVMATCTFFLTLCGEEAYICVSASNYLLTNLQEVRWYQFTGARVEKFRHRV